MKKSETVLNAANQQMPNFSEESMKVLKIAAEHSGRNVAYYDIEWQMAREYSVDSGLSDWMLVDALLEFGTLSAESQIRVDQILREIRSGGGGGGGGDTVLQIRGTDGDARWFSLKYSPVVDKKSGRLGVIISYQDVTEHHRYELTYLRQKQMIEQEKAHIGQLEADLNADVIEIQNGSMMPLANKSAGETLTSFAHRMVELKMQDEDQEAALEFFSCAYLLDQYQKGNYLLERTWKMRFSEGNIDWVRVVVELVLDSYTGHIKAFFKLSDITIERETQMLTKLRAERDGLTGLLNRSTVEYQIRECMKTDEVPGILILLDLDDLKKVNDTYGHIEGDRAICGIAQALKSQFRQTDILGRIGGDEFMVYLRGAAESSDAISVKLIEFSKRLSALSVGQEGSHSLHCSIGCAIQEPQTDDFETLYRRADVALYHVKRSTKNGFAFYDTEMERESTRSRSETAQDVRIAAREEMLKVPEEGERLLDAILDCYELVLSMNLTANRYVLAAEVSNGVFSKLPLSGTFADFFDLVLKGVHTDDLADFQRKLSRDGLIQAYKDGARSMRSRFRFIHDGSYRYVETIVILYTNKRGDVCDFTLLRWD